MSGRVRQRATANANMDAATTTVNERILRECHALYTDETHGMVSIAQNVDLKLLAPRKKITIMLIGNHSAGKSSFINWYIEEHVQRTGVAIETQGFSFVTSGRRRESLTGNATLHLYPHFQPLLDFPGVVDYLQTEVSTSKEKKFPLVTFVDTPGLVDGDMNYPFDVNEAILWLGDLVDMIFVFFDPIGQALCKRTLNIVESLSAKHSERMRFYLSKADEAGHESDRQRVMMQIVQELCKRPTLNRTGFEMPTIFIPNPDKPSRCVNQIEDVCKDIEKTITQTIQNTLNQLEKDCDEIGDLVDSKIARDNEARSHNLRAGTKGILLFFLGLTLPLALLVNLLATSFPQKMLKDLLGLEGMESLKLYLSPIRGFWDSIPQEYHFYALLTLALLTLILLGAAKFLSRSKATMSRKHKKKLLEQQTYVRTVVKDKKQSLYKEYLQQMVSEHDL
ncbi:hypothetical protein TCAL_10665 [Tigriopus californicus]|uniref:G domain-containing protein n=1 Tax=Tigriopus californicus TaxID=6832 RepID=A0A553NYL3_TIGCA|nr:EH domain-containing protein 3-like isoform X1 [Tigriopus californicus]XP_059090281.1 EH domain-containing protein 3-like isoform X1 [Tigriopus californicus]TRY70520.1 hypothetical protein TCAL_10665 [Tigriopus californicus]|eukprot:TCALIF_10665-PA protein Name:"Similar to SRL Sarcalumenin (Gallus gallus)" AED:0.09 eAED:0.09 QI:223/1/1/1/0.37/0.44/9/201/449